MKILAIIPARGGSKGITKKNIRLLGGKPLIAWTIEASLSSKYVDRIVVSSDSPEILNIASKFGAEVIKRPDRISQDNSPLQLLIVHALSELLKKDGYSPDLVVYLQPTSPLRSGADIDKAIELMRRKKADALISVFRVDSKFLKTFILDNSGNLKGATGDEYPFANRQDLPDLFMPNGAIYVIKTAIFLKNNQLFASKTVPYLMDDINSVDVDSLTDLARIERILKWRLQKKH